MSRDKIFHRGLRVALVCTALLPVATMAETAPLASIMKDRQRPAKPGMMPNKAMLQRIPVEQGYPQATPHTGDAHDPDEAYTSIWTRADARQIKAMSNPNVTTGANSLPAALTMPAIPSNFPATNGYVWVWDTWPLTDYNGNQYTYNGWDVIFALTARRDAGYTFDDRHVHARIGFFYRPHKTPRGGRPANGGWTYGGNVFPDGQSAEVYSKQNTPFTQQAEWSGSTRIEGKGKNGIKIFYTDLAFNRTDSGDNITAPVATITLAIGSIHADYTHVWFGTFNPHTPLLVPDGKYYQTGQQNEYYSFRDPAPFTDPAHPGETYMVFEGNSAGVRGETPCNASDLGYAANDPYGETVDQVNGSGAIFQRANIGLAVATNADLTAWKFLPPLISANCVNDQTERPQMHIQHGKYYLMTISHRTTFAAGIDGPDGEYAFYGKGIRSDWVPLNNNSGLMLGNPTDLNVAAGTDFSPNPEQNPNAFQSYSHYFMPNGKVTSFIDTVGTRRGGDEAPTVQISLSGPNSSLNYAFGSYGLGGYGEIVPNKLNIDKQDFIADVAYGEEHPYHYAGEPVIKGLSVKSDTSTDAALKNDIAARADAYLNGDLTN
ncbi:glycoside hydrolase family 68 protein [Gluconobacter sp. P5B12]|uniref:glycoside hydrolase family 68 protein n=1 Tax=Gluconobacter sp. P5B12 TaxID=2762618 RepID=UPI001C03F0FB|nr:glycoside hydrolase family 68 protein [Gluconobacter sp. P5B12]